MKSAALLVGLLLTLLLSPPARAADDCKGIRGDSAGFLMQCGDQIRSFVFKSSNTRWREDDTNGGLDFNCIDMPDLTKLPLLERFDERATKGSPCPDEPKIQVSRMSSHSWDTSGKDAPAILHVWEELLSGRHIHRRGPMPTPACPAFDVSIGDLRGRATCVVDNDGGAVLGVEGGFVLGVFADRHTTLLLSFFQEGKRQPEEMKKKMLGLTSQFTIERATGDAALLRWMK